MRIVLTGACGFIGRHLYRLLQPDHDVLATDIRLSGFTGIEGSIDDPGLHARLFAQRCDAVIHLATVAGAAAERDPVSARRINIDATMGLIEAAAAGEHCPRFIFASSIAVFGNHFVRPVDDATPLAPQMLYGGHKAMMEQWVAVQSRRGAIRGMSLRLPGIVARPVGDPTMKSAFMSDIFHALRAGSPYRVPVSPDATMWLMSVDRICRNVLGSLGIEADGAAVNLPPLRIRFGDLVTEVARQTGHSSTLVSYLPDAALEHGFGRYPDITTPTATRLGFASDGDLASLVASALTTIAEGESQ